MSRDREAARGREELNVRRRVSGNRDPNRKVNSNDKEKRGERNDEEDDDAEGEGVREEKERTFGRAAMGAANGTGMLCGVHKGTASAEGRFRVSAPSERGMRQGQGERR